MNIFNQLHHHPLKRGGRVLVWVALMVLGLLGPVAAEPRGPDGPDDEQRRAGADVETNTASAQVPPGEPPTCTARPIPFDGGAGRVVVRIDIHDTIDLGLAPFVERVLEESAERPEVALVLLHMNTPGGRVDAAQQIKDALLKSTIPTATFIDTHALSAGALIAYATDFIIVTDGSTMGAATPINIGQQGEAQAVGEKFVSAVRAIFQSTAEAKGRDGRIAEAMVDKDVEVPGLVAEGKLLTLAKEAALTWCVADLTARDVPGVLSALKLDGADIEKRELNWAERIARILTDPMISSLLMSFGFLGLMLELYTAGFGIAGIIGITCLVLFFVGHLVVNLVGLEEIVLFVLGLVFLGVELFVTPGFGLAGVAGILSLVTALVLSMLGANLTFSWEIGEVGGAIQRTALALTGTIVVFMIAARFLPRSGLFGRLVLQGTVARTSFEEPAPERLVRPGTRGVAITHIRGSGKAELDGETVDVVSQGGLISRGDPVVVVDARPGRVVVERGEA